MKRSFVIYGAGGHAKVLHDLVVELGFSVDCLFDDSGLISSFGILSTPVYRYDPERFPAAKLLIGVGNNMSRKKIASFVKHEFGTLIHPLASVSKSVDLGSGTIVLANATIQADTKVGAHVIVNSNACIDHEVHIESFVHVSPLSYIGSCSIIKEGVTVRACTAITRNVTLSKDN